MTIIFTHDIICNHQGKNCLRWINGCVGYTVDRLTARRTAKKAGWFYDGHKDVCPECGKELGYESKSDDWRPK